MANTLAFLSNDYTEAEAKLVFQKIEPVCELIGGYDTVLRRTTKELKVDMRKAEYTDEKIYSLTQQFIKEYPENFQEKLDQYLQDNNAYYTVDIRKGQYVIASVLGMSTHKTLADVLHKMNIPFNAMEQWYSDEFSEDDFENVEVENVSISIENVVVFFKNVADADELKWELISLITAVGLGCTCISESCLITDRIELENGIVLEKGQYACGFAVLKKELDELLKKFDEKKLEYSAVIAVKDFFNDNLPETKIEYI